MLVLKEVIWLGDSKDILSDFPGGVRADFGFELYRLQLGIRSLKSRPMKSIGKGVFELKEQDIRGWYRILYTVEVKNKIYILHCFRKQSNKTEQHDLRLARTRLSQIED